MFEHKQLSENEDTSEITRFGVSMSTQLLNQFDALIATLRYTNRSEAIRDLIRNRLVELEWETGKGKIVGVVVMVYEHEIRMLEEKITYLQHHMNHPETWLD